MIKENYKIRFNKKFVVSVGVINNYSGIVNFIKEELDSQLQDILLEVEGMFTKIPEQDGVFINYELSEREIGNDKALLAIQVIIKNRMENV